MKFIANYESLVLCNNCLLFINEKEKQYLQYKKDFVETISKEVYLQKKYGPQYQKIQDSFYADLSICSGNFDEKSDLVVACFYQENVIRIFSANHNSENFDIEHWPTEIYDVKINEDDLWVVYPTDNIIKKYSISKKRKMKEYTENNGLNYPESIFIDGNDNVYVSNMGDKNILMLDKSNETFKQYLTFEEPVWEFVKDQDVSYVRLSSGVYML